ncbi:hypothetical protein [Streptomyces sp. CB03238]|uniref:hypothetical protein n=1 Tax=Streptomyces sp. CB03238 TaxID=1907777 RepID=UPI00117EDA08|nr:hypothetical protein [Streptomyces sp. CB03238]
MKTQAGPSSDPVPGIPEVTEPLDRPIAMRRELRGRIRLYQAAVVGTEPEAPVWDGNIVRGED